MELTSISIPTFTPDSLDYEDYSTQKRYSDLPPVHWIANDARPNDKGWVELKSIRDVVTGTTPIPEGYFSIYIGTISEVNSQTGKKEEQKLQAEFLGERLDENLAVILPDIGKRYFTRFMCRFVRQYHPDERQYTDTQWANWLKAHDAVIRRDEGLAGGLQAQILADSQDLAERNAASRNPAKFQVQLMKEVMAETLKESRKEAAEVALAVLRESGYLPKGSKA